MTDVTEATFMDGRSAETETVRARIEGPYLVASREVGAELVRWPIGQLHVDALNEHGVAHVEWPGARDAVLALRDPAFTHALAAGGARVHALPFGRRAAAIGLGSFVFFAVLLGLAYLNSGVVSAAVARRVPAEVERALSPRMQALVARHTCRTVASDAALAELRDRLDPDHRVRADVRIVNLRVVNGYALPGGVVLLTSDLLAEAESPDEVAGVLAHELAHVERRDALSQMIRNTLLGALWSATLGDYSGLMVVDPKTAYDTATLSFSRDEEAAADEASVDRLTRAGISTRGVSRFLQRLAESDEDRVTWLSTHPSPADRTAILAAQRLAAEGPPVLDANAFADLKMACTRTPEAGSVRDLFF
ncbi:MAG TPA: M48 family metallopeptidase [Polyangiaceae bacterium]|nr:M48 family metallopeptidase [Polyangiaceae bacterium]